METNDVQSLPDAGASRVIASPRGAWGRGSSTDLLTWKDGSRYSLGGSTPSNGYTTEVSRVAAGADLEKITVEANSTDEVFFRLKATAQ